MCVGRGGDLGDGFREGDDLEGVEGAEERDDVDGPHRRVVVQHLRAYYSSIYAYIHTCTYKRPPPPRAPRNDLWALGISSCECTMPHTHTCVRQAYLCLDVSKHMHTTHTY